MFSSWHFPSSRRLFVLVTVGAVLGLVGCRNDPQDPRFNDPALQRPNGSKKLTVVFVDGVPVPADSASGPLAAAPGRKAPPSQPAPVRMDISWQVPDGWTSVPPSSRVRVAEYRVDASEPNGTPAEVGVFYLGPSVTAIDDTLQRWASSFDEAAAKNAKRAMLRTGAFPAHFVEVSGTYTVPSMMAEEGANEGAQTRPGWKLLGAIVETPMGPYYFKLLGPKEVVEGGREKFLKMIDSVGREAAGAATPSATPPSASATPPVSSAPDR
jgi:hypothetical protein